MRRGRGRRRGSVWSVWVAVCLGAGPVWAADGGTRDPGRPESADEGELAVEDAKRSPRRIESADPAGNSPGLDALLQLPSGFITTEPDAVAGAGESEWRRRFAKAEGELADARERLEATKRELDKLAVGGGGSQWSISPVGGGENNPTSSPLSFKLRQQLRGDRDKIDQLEKALRELRIEADLAGVPQTWRVAGTTSGNRAPESERP